MIRPYPLSNMPVMVRHDGLLHCAGLIGSACAAWYTFPMSHSGAHLKPHRTARLPVTTIEELPLLTEAERTDLIISLQEAQECATSGQYIEHDPDTFVDQLLEIRI